MPRNLDSHFTVHVNGSITENISPNIGFEVFEGIPCSGNELTLNNILKAKRIYAYSKKLGMMEMVIGINFEDVRVGDKIRTSYVYQDVEITKVGIVSRTTTTIWANGVAMANKTWENLYIELLERPLPTEPGTVFRATEIRGKSCDVVAFVGQSTLTNSGVFYVSATPIGGMSDFGASDITAWESIN